MSKECKECDYFDGYDYDDGTPNCSCEGGYESCPFNDMAPAEKKGIKIEIDSGFMDDYIKHTIKNTVESCTVSLISSEIKNIVHMELRDKVLDMTRDAIEASISDQVSEFMNGDISVGGGWSEPARTITRKEYMSELIEKQLGEKFKSAVPNACAEEAKKAIESFAKKTRDQINAGIRQYFNEATRQILTDNVVSMLMENDTYQKLSNSMKTFLPEGK